MLLTGVAHAYEVPTHQSITRAAGDLSEANQVLSGALGLGDGLDSTVVGQSLSLWLTQGARREDNIPRPLNHFHNPLAADWSQAGFLGNVGQSSILWGQSASQSFPSWSWQDVRQAYFEALTSASKPNRDTRLATTFEGLGHQVHLIQDAASPGHTRNDPHVFYNYESLVDEIRIQEANLFSAWLAGSPDTPGAPDVGWRFLDGNPLAPIAVARLIDTDRYTGGNPISTSEPLIGLAEYTNANFFSEDRIFSENDVNVQKHFPFPNRASVTVQDFDVVIGNATVKRRYFVKTGDGATGYRLAAVGFLRDYHQRFNLDWTRFRESPSLDESVYRDYAARLVPRAVAYSTALIDYFFRGQMIVDGTDLAMDIRNPGEEAMDGTFALYYDDAGETRRPVPGATWARTLAPGAMATGLRVTAPTNPAPRDPGKYMLVFRGRMGSEPDAVVGKHIVLESVLFPRLIKRSDGTPLRGVVVQAIDVLTGQPLSSGQTDNAGRTRLSWKPGRTILFIPNANFFPMFWAGGSAFSSGVEGARVVQAADVDAQGEVTIPIPLVFAQWPERVEACTEQPLFANAPAGFFQRTTEIGGGLFDFVSVTYGVNLITFIRGDNGSELPLCGGTGGGGCIDPAAGFVAEDVNRVGQVVAELVRDVYSSHFRSIVDSDTRPVGPPVCNAEYAEVEVVPVTVGER